MAKQLHELNFEFKAENPVRFPDEFLHYGVVGSGDMEAIIEKKELNGLVNIRVVTPVTGFDDVWQLVLQRFVDDTCIADASIEINDNNATPVVVSLRLRQALAEIAGGAV